FQNDLLATPGSPTRPDLYGTSRTGMHGREPEEHRGLREGPRATCRAPVAMRQQQDITLDWKLLFLFSHLRPCPGFRSSIAVPMEARDQGWAPPFHRGRARPQPPWP